MGLGCDVTADRAASERAMAVSRANAACSSDASCGSWCVGVTRHVTPPPPTTTGLSSLWAGTALKRASETQHPEDGERLGGGETELNGVSEWKT